MNIFVLDRDPTTAAQMACDQHASKMVLETAQLLSTVNHIHTGHGPYKKTHEKHPCTLWAAGLVNNYHWLWTFGMAQAEEFRFRRGKDHKSAAVIAELKDPPMTTISKGSITFVQCMPEEFKHKDVVQAYRAFYIGDKARFAKWEWGRTPPDWWPRRK